MAIAYTSKSNTVATDTATSSSFTPAVGSLIVVLCETLTQNNRPGISLSTTGFTTGQWTVTSYGPVNTSFERHTSHIAWAEVQTSAAGTVSVAKTDTPNSATVGAEFIEVTGWAKVAQVAYATSTGASLSMSFPQTPASSSYVFTNCTNGGSGTPTRPSTVDTNLVTPVTLSAGSFIAAHAVDTTSPAQTTTWTGLGSFSNVGTAIEITAAPSAPSFVSASAPELGLVVGSPIAHVGSSYVGYTDTTVTTYTQSMTATVTSTVTDVLRVNKIVSVTQASTVAFVRSVAKTLSVTAASAKTITLQARKTLSVTQASTAAVVRQVNKVLSVTQASTVSFARRANLVLSRTVAGAASIVKQARLVLGATANSTETIASQTQFNRTLSVTQASTVAFVRRVNKTVAAAATGAPSFTRSIAKTLSAAATGAASLVKQANKVLAAAGSGAVSIASSVLTGVTIYPQSMTATVNATANIVRSTTKVLSAATTGTVDMARSIAKTLSAAAAGTATVVKQVAKTLGAAGSVAVSLLAQGAITYYQTLTVTVAATVTFTKRIAATVNAVIVTWFTTTKQITKTLAQSVTGAPTLVKERIVPRTLTVTVSSARTMVRQTQKVYTIAVTGSSSFTKRISLGLRLWVRGTSTVATPSYQFVLTPGAERRRLNRIDAWRAGVRDSDNRRKTNVAPYALIKEAGVYTRVEPGISPDRIAAAQMFYRSGYTYDISMDEALALTRAGYGSMVTVV